MSCCSTEAMLASMRSSVVPGHQQPPPPHACFNKPKLPSQVSPRPSALDSLTSTAILSQQVCWVLGALATERLGLVRGPKRRHAQLRPRQAILGSLFVAGAQLWCVCVWWKHDPADCGLCHAPAHMMQFLGPPRSSLQKERAWLQA